jgi:hypothetical protein
MERTMKRQIAVLLAASALAAAAAAQHSHDDDDEGTEAPVHEGQWAVVMEDGRGERWTGRFDLRDYNGTWKVAPAKGPRDPKCDGKPTPISVQASTEKRLDITVWGTSVAPHCNDLTLLLKPQPDGRLKATLADGRTVVLTRRPDKRAAAKH